jgi:sn-glycerol 3-phosphate transport system substrate-binding protein
MPRNARRRTGALAALAALSVLAAACSGSSSNPDVTTNDAPGADVLTNAKAEVAVTFWHSMDGKNGDALNSLIGKFNAAHQGKIKVSGVYQGKYDDAITAYKGAVQSNQTPSMIQVYDIGTRFMIDSKQAIPMQSFIDKDQLDVSDLQPNIRGYYSVDNKLYSMPFNTSMPILYYNKDAFRAAGLDPDKAPATLAEIRAAAEKLTKGGKIGFGAAIYGWFVEQWAAEAGTEYCNNGNGRDSSATAVSFNSDTGVTVLDWWSKMVKDGLAANTGKTTTDAQNAFTSGKVAMLIESTGVLRSFTAASQGKFALGTGFYPKVDASNTGGPIIGGASLWIDGAGHSAEEARASWEFVKFLEQKDSQAFWHTNTGYFPVSKAALNEPADLAWRKQYPQFDTAIQQLDKTTLSKATQGCALGVMPQSRKATEDAIEAVFSGSKTPKQALDAAATSLSGQIADYNKSVK